MTKTPVYGHPNRHGKDFTLWSTQVKQGRRPYRTNANMEEWGTWGDRGGKNKWSPEETENTV